MTQAIEDVKETILETVEPSENEKAQLHEVVAELTARVTDETASLSIAVDALHVGSTARGTWLSTERDIDLFLLFDPATPRDVLETTGLQIGHSILPSGHEEYAEHPYVRGSFEGFDVDIVPCYAVDSPNAIQSSVDRTPFHNEYILNTITPSLKREIRVTKQFLSGIGVYGSNLRTRGFSGYLTELLVIEYDSFENFLETAANWMPPVYLDPENHGKDSFDDPLILIDPTDPSRNVAAVLSRENIARLQHYARAFLADPRASLLYASPPDPLEQAAFKRHLQRRETTCLAIVFRTPDIVEDELYPQLQKSRDGITDAFTRAGFEVIRSAAFAHDRSVLWFELDRETLPAIERHGGPPLAVRSHAERFFKEYNEKDVYGPFVAGDRYVVEREREITSIQELCTTDSLTEMRLGPAVSNAIKENHTIYIGLDTVSLLDEFGRDFARYFDPNP